MICTEARTRDLVAAVAAASVEAEAAWQELKPLGQDVVPLFADAFPRAKTWQGHVALVFHCVRFARSSTAAFDLGLRALRDKSYMVCYRACGLLAYSLRKDAVPHLQPLLAHTDRRTVDDAAAAIAAISAQNHHRFVDRSESGRSFWEVNPGDLSPG